MEKQLKAIGSLQWLPKLLLALVLLGSFLRVVDVVFDSPLNHLFSDPARHWNNGLRFWNPEFMGGADPILYQFYVYILVLVTGENRFLVALIGGLLSAIMPWTYYKASRELGFSRTPALAVWALVTWTPSLWTIYNYFMMETLLLPLLGLGLWMAGRCLRKQTLESFLLLTLCWVLACLTKSSIVPVTVFCVGYVWWRTSRQWRWAVASLLLALAMVAPNAWRSKSVFGFSAPFGLPWIAKIMHRTEAKHIEIHIGSSYWIFSSPSAYVRPFEPFNNWMMERASNEQSEKVWIDTSKGERDWIEAYNRLPFDLGVWWRGQKENFAMLLFAPSWPESSYQTLKGLINYWHRFLWAPLIMVVVLLNIRNWLVLPQNLIPVITMLFLIFLMFQPFAIVEGRYRKPLEPLLWMNLVWCLTPACTQIRKRIFSV